MTHSTLSSLAAAAFIVAIGSPAAAFQQSAAPAGQGTGTASGQPASPQGADTPSPTGQATQQPAPPTQQQPATPTQQPATAPNQQPTSPTPQPGPTQPVAAPMVQPQSAVPGTGANGMPMTPGMPGTPTAQGNGSPTTQRDTNGATVLLDRIQMLVGGMLAASDGSDSLSRAGKVEVSRSSLVEITADLIQLKTMLVTGSQGE